MDVVGIIADLRAELDQLNEAIMALERISFGQQRRRGRPPAWLTALKTSEAPDSTPKRRGRPPGSKNKQK